MKPLTKTNNMKTELNVFPSYTLIATENNNEDCKCYVVVSCSINEGYYFNNSYVFKNRMDAEKYIEQLDSEDIFDIVKLNFID